MLIFEGLKLNIIFRLYKNQKKMYVISVSILLETTKIHNSRDFME